MSKIDVRIFAWHDIFTLYRYRNELLSLDSVSLLTRGSPLGFVASVSQLHPAYGTFTAVARSPKGTPPLIGQMLYRMGHRSARISFLVPYPTSVTQALQRLLDEMAQQAGEWGACNILAEVEERHPAFEALRRAGFVVYAWQRVWRLLPTSTNGKQKPALWHTSTPTDEPAIRGLYQNLVPLLVQGAETAPGHRLPGLVYKQNGEVLGYIEGIHGPRGIFLNPVIHPSVDDAGELLENLVQHLSPLLGRSVYLAMRSYQAWLEPYLEKMNTEVSPRQALLVKHLTHLQRAAVTNHLLGVIENRQSEPTAPIMQNIAQPKHENE